MGFNQIEILPDKGIKIILWTNEKEFRTDVFKSAVNQSTFNFDDVPSLQKTIEKLEFKEDTDYTIFGLSFTTKKFV